MGVVQELKLKRYELSERLEELSKLQSGLQEQIRSIDTVITMLVILSYLHWQLAIRSFSLITSVPDRVTRWFGQGGENLGEENEATKSTQFLVGNITNRTERGIAAFGLASGGGGGGGGKNKERPEKEGDKKKDGDGDATAPSNRV